MPGTVLHIAHTFPPAAGSGSHRALAFDRYLSAFGWRPVVLTPGESWAANRDDRLLGDVPAGLRVVRTRSLEPRPAPRPAAATLGAGAAAGPRGRPAALRWAASQAAHVRRFPDAHRGWIPFAVASGLRAVRDERVDVLYSTAGPFSSHVVGLLLHRLTGRPWIAELRDGWYRWNRDIFPDYPVWRGWLEAPLESVVVGAAARVVLTTELMARSFRAQYPGLPAAHFAPLPNGFDPEQLAGLPPASPPSDVFEVLHAGALYHGRSIEAFLQAAGRLGSAEPAFARAFRLRLVGSLDEGARVEVARQLQRFDLGERVEYAGYLDHAAALASMRRADLLLLLVNTTPGAEATVPGKLFEYLAVGRPVLAIVPPGAEAADILARTEAGWSAPAHDPDAILDCLRTAFRAHVERRQPTPRPEEVARFDRRQLTQALAGLLDEAAASGAGGR